MRPDRPGISVETTYYLQPEPEAEVGAPDRWAAFRIAVGRHGHTVKISVREARRVDDLPAEVILAEQAFWFDAKNNGRDHMLAQALVGGDMRGKYAESVFHSLVFPVYVSDFFATWFPAGAAFYRKHWETWRIAEGWCLNVSPNAVAEARKLLADTAIRNRPEREVAAELVALVDRAPPFKLETVSSETPMDGVYLSRGEAEKVADAIFSLDRPGLDPKIADRLRSAIK